MVKKIRNILSIYKTMTETYSTRILNSAITYNLILIIIPFFMLVTSIAEKLKLNLPILQQFETFKFNGFIPSIVLIINIFWSSSTMVLTFHDTSDIIYVDVKRQNYWRRRILSFVYFVFIILMISLSLLGIVIFNYIIRKTNFIFLKYILQVSVFIWQFMSVWIIASFLYKKIIPVKIEFKKTLKSSFIITLIWYLLTLICLPLMSYLLKNSYERLYHSLASLFILIYYMYLLSNLFVMGIIYQYYQYKKSIESLEKEIILKN